jgi:hypothetical protein
VCTVSAVLDADGVAAEDGDVTAGPRPDGVAPYTLAAGDDAATEPEPAASSANASISVRIRPRRPMRKTRCRDDDTRPPSRKGSSPILV